MHNPGRAPNAFNLALTTMNFLSLSRSVSVVSQRIVAPSLVQFVAVTPRRVSEVCGGHKYKGGAEGYQAASTAKDVKASIEAKIQKGFSAMTFKPSKPAATKPTRSKSPGTIPCWVDASPTHIAIVIGDCYKVFALNNGWMTKSRDVNWAETAAFELLARILAQQGRSGVVHVNSDSAAALRAMSGERLYVYYQRVKVSRTTNVADGFTRGKVVNGYKEMGDNITVPDALVPFVKAL
ncbi:hypothetical protein RHS01_10612 [Rhizoctonia solani]|uniref:RNase H type-1 domain-containing protein n=1 Tax=Rhizoctonia solani TaxID=456999 RepID=A0A8H7I3N5_9AGAM|nr:hypothetical protein RHS01_10612 [Rhizoctonia solani]